MITGQKIQGSTLFEVAQSVEYVDMVVQESLRMYPAAPMYVIIIYTANN